MTDTLAHRGPDSRGTWIDPDNGVGLGHRRLAIRDLAPTGHQEPFADSSQIPTALVCALTRAHVTVVLSGDGGDELFAGYNRYTLGLDMWHKANIAPYPMRRMLARALLAQPTARLDALGRCLPARWRRPQLGNKLHKFAHAIVLGHHSFDISGPILSCVACPGRASPLSALRPCPPVGLSHRILIQDGSSFAIRDTWREVFPGRFKAVKLTAVELHTTRDLVRDAPTVVVLTLDTARRARHLGWCGGQQMCYTVAGLSRLRPT